MVTPTAIARGVTPALSRSTTWWTICPACAAPHQTSYGAVQERDEGNNLFGSVSSTAGSDAAEAAVISSQATPPLLEGLPQR